MREDKEPQGATRTRSPAGWGVSCSSPYFSFSLRSLQFCGYYHPTYKNVPRFYLGMWRGLRSEPSPAQPLGGVEGEEGSRAKQLPVTGACPGKVKLQTPRLVGPLPRTCLWDCCRAGSPCGIKNRSIVTILSGTKLFPGIRSRCHLPPFNDRAHSSGEAWEVRPEGSIPELPSKAIFVLVWRAWQGALEAHLPLP